MSGSRPSALALSRSDGSGNLPASHLDCRLASFPPRQVARRYCPPRKEGKGDGLPSLELLGEIRRLRWKSILSRWAGTGAGRRGLSQ